MDTRQLKEKKRISSALITNATKRRFGAKFTHDNIEYTISEGSCGECEFYQKRECESSICTGSKRRDKKDVCYKIFNGVNDPRRLTINKSIGEHLKKLGMSGTDIARECGIDPDNTNRYLATGVGLRGSKIDLMLSYLGLELVKKY